MRVAVDDEVVAGARLVLLELHDAAAGRDERRAALGEHVLALVAAAAAERRGAGAVACAGRGSGRCCAGTMKEPGIGSAGVRGAAACAEEAVAPDADVRGDAEGVAAVAAGPGRRRCRPSVTVCGASGATTPGSQRVIATPSESADELDRDRWPAAVPRTM